MKFLVIIGKLILLIKIPLNSELFLWEDFLTQVILYVRLFGSIWHRSSPIPTNVSLCTHKQHVLDPSQIRNRYLQRNLTWSLFIIWKQRYCRYFVVYCQQFWVATMWRNSHQESSSSAGEIIHGIVCVNPVSLLWKIYIGLLA